MDLRLTLLVLTALAIGLLVSVLVLRRRRKGALAKPTAGERKGAAVASSAGGEMADLSARPKRRRGGITPAGLAVIVLPLLILAAGGWFVVSQLNARSTDRFLVLVAPFDDGSDGQTGRNVAQELVRQIAQQPGAQIIVRMAERRPTTPEEAQSIADTEQSDVLIWGVVEPGAMLDSQSLSPQLMYTPNGAYAPNGWVGYQGRFAMPKSYTLASEPINGQVVLPTLVVALFDYGLGQPDRAGATLDRLVSDYPALTNPLPQALLGNIYWARGSYGEAADAYRRALAEPSVDQALLANNLGAILLDAGDAGVLSAFAEAVRLLDGNDLGELRYNLGMLALNDQRPGDAMVDLEQARNLLPANTSLLLSLTAAYRESGRLGSADDALAAAQKQAEVDVRAVPEIYRAMIDQHYKAAINEQRGMLGLAGSLNAQGPLVWELEIAAPLPEQAVSDQRNQLSSAVEASEQVSGRWHQRSASDSATDLDAGQVAAGQADRAESAARRQRYELALLDAELTRARSEKPSSAINQLLNALFSVSTPIGESLSLLDSLAQRDPDSPAILIAQARALRVNGQLNDADRVYDRVVQVAAQRPEGYFGKAMIARDRSDYTAAAQLLRMAIERNGAFFPARVELALIDQQSGNLSEAIEQLRAVSVQRPGPTSAIPLAQALRLSGPDGYAEAEQVLQPLRTASAAAAIELGRLYNDAGHGDAAIAAYRDALKVERRNTIASFELGERLVAAGDLKGAEQALRDALSFDDTNTAARLALARLYDGPLAQPAQADKEYGVALSQGVNDFNTLIVIGDTALANQNPNQAIEAYTRAARLDPNSALANYKLAVVYLSTNRLQSAADAAQLAINQIGESSDPALRAQALVVLGDVARNRGDLARASDLYDQAQKIAPQMIAAQLG
ncbi:MAG: tetratricopeptide repeat protein, partial [Oscillochloris sp.]|nr:tetratricopeptide repeat protein [Oscillochloris sp.]